MPGVKLPMVYEPVPPVVVIAKGVMPPLPVKLKVPLPPVVVLVTFSDPEAALATEQETVFPEVTVTPLLQVSLVFDQPEPKAPSVTV